MAMVLWVKRSIPNWSSLPNDLSWFYEDIPYL
jgi:hypothetical protein